MKIIDTLIYKQIYFITYIQSNYSVYEACNYNMVDIVHIVHYDLWCGCANHAYRKVII